MENKEINVSLDEEYFKKDDFLKSWLLMIPSTTGTAVTLTYVSIIPQEETKAFV